MPRSQNNGTLNEAQTTSVDTIKVRQQSFFKRGHAYQIGPAFFSSRAENHLPKSAVCFMIFLFRSSCDGLRVNLKSKGKQARDCVFDAS